MTTQTERPLQTPAYRRIQGAIVERIVAGELRPGDRVESERQLAQAHGVSLMTARHALKALEKDGRVECRPGAGTYVALPKVQFNKLASFSEHMAVRGLLPRSQLIAARALAGSDEICANLGLPSGAELIKIERVRQADGQAFALESCYLIPEVVPGILLQPLEQRSLFRLLEEEFHLELAYADEEVDATAADPRTARLLRVTRGAPLLRIRQLLYASTATPIAYTLGLYRSDRHSVSIRRFR